MTDVLDRFVFDADTKASIAVLTALGFSHVGTTTFRGNVEELAFFNKDGVRVDFNFRNMPDEKKPSRPEDKEFWSDNGMGPTFYALRYRCTRGTCNAAVMVADRKTHNQYHDRNGHA